MSALSGFRAGQADIDDGTNGFEEASANPRDAAAVYYVRLWCRTRQGQSCLVVVYDATSTYYRRLTGLSDDALPRALAHIAEQEFGLHSGLRAAIVHRHTSNGWVPSAQDANVPATFPWLELRAAAPRIKNRTIFGETTKQNLLLRAAEATGTSAMLASTTTAEKSTPVHTQTCQKMGIKPGGWFSIGSDIWRTARRPRDSGGVAVHCTWLLHLAETEVRGSAAIEQLPPLRVLSYDIECYSHDDAFPDADRPEDTIITIGVHVKTLYANTVATGVEDAPEQRLALVLGAAVAPIDNGEVRCFATEAELLLAFADAVAHSDADFLVGYNIVQFDNEYIWKRATLLQQQGALTSERFGRIFAWSRMCGLPCIPGQKQLGSGAFGDNSRFRAIAPGRVDLDLWFERRDNAADLPNLKLNTVAEHYLGETKFDLPPKQIFALYRVGSPEGLAEVAAYCVQDCELVTRLLERLDVLASTLQMAFITGVTASQILWRGQGVKITTLLLEEAHRQNYVLEDMKEEERRGGGNGNDPGEHQRIEGATVIEPIQGMYNDPILCLDFASLYPSLMRTFTGCISTYVSAPALVATEVYRVPNTDHHFVTSRVSRGIIPRILDNLTAARQAAKRSMKEATDPQRKALFNSRQLAIKISANSIYGFTGSRTGTLTAIPVAESTTGMGRHVIDMTAKYVEAQYAGAQVTYGDTDSIFVRLPPHLRGASIAELFELGASWARAVTKHIADSLPFQSYVELEFEKVLAPLILWKKKRYAGLCYESAEEPPKLLVKGIELVRRDSLPLVKTMQEDILRRLLFDRDAAAAVALIRGAVETILAVPCGGPYDAIVQSKSLRSSYKNENGMTHVQVARNMATRAPGSAPKVGDRVHYIICASTAKRVVDRAEEPQHAAAARLAIDYTHYVEAVETPLLRLAEIPLQTLSPGAFDELAAFLVRARNRARALNAEHCRCRAGAAWKDGHMTKDGKIQQKLVFVKRTPPQELAAVPKRSKRGADTSSGSGRGRPSIANFFKRREGEP